MTTISISRADLGTFAAAASREWLVTNGLGGYAAGTIANATTRRYHGVLVAALRPPVERTVMVTKVDATVRYRGSTIGLTSNEYADGTIDPHGYRYLDRFRLDGTLPVWSWIVGDARIEARLWMAHGENTTYLSWTLLQGSDSIEIDLAPLCTWRDYHWHSRGAPDVSVNPVDHGVEVHAGPRPYRLLADCGAWEIGVDRHWNLKHRLETERGLDDVEDLFRPAVCRVRLAPGAAVNLILTAESRQPDAPLETFARERARQAQLIEQAFPSASARHTKTTETARPAFVDQLVLAADQFIVERRDGAGRPLGHSVIAGYPWFSDWGRDTMIALPGLALATRRPELAASVLRTFARFVSEGMLPNRFPDAGEAPEYNTVDATLWYFVAVDAYLRSNEDDAFAREIYPVLGEILGWHRRGTRYGIHVDTDDGLLAAGVPGVQLTWMDAKLGDWVVTPRIGKPVEINALWFNALSITRDLARRLGDDAASRELTAEAERVARSFTSRFWFEQGAYLYDVIDGPEGEIGPDGKRRDASLRPNQLFALSLPHPLLDNGRARSVVDVCARELWTPVGLRSLAPQDPQYSGHYTGGPHERDAVYHQGTVWSWLSGPFALAHYRAYGHAERALEFLTPIDGHLRAACLGQVSEIFDGDSPFHPRGCFAQAWSVAELLRIWREIHEDRIVVARRATRSGSSTRDPA
jgi:predicted glycogen debranching enzyme